MGFFDFIRIDPTGAAADTRRKIDETRAEIAAGEERLTVLAREREQAIGDIDNAGYLKLVAAVDKKIEAEAANIAACVSRVQVLKQRLRSAEIAVLEARKADFIAHIQKLLPRRQRSAQKITAGINLIARGLLDLESADAELFAEPGWDSVRALIPPSRYRANIRELFELKNNRTISSQFDAAAAVEKLNGDLIALLQEGALPSPPSDEDDDETPMQAESSEAAEQQFEEISA